MSIGDILIDSAELILKHGLARGLRKDDQGRHCALGAIEAAIAIRHGEEYNGGLGRYHPEYGDATLAVARVIPMGSIVRDDPFNGPINKFRNKHPDRLNNFGFEGTQKVAWFSNTHSQAEVIDLFLKAAVDAGVGLAAAEWQQAHSKELASIR